MKTYKINCFTSSVLGSLLEQAKLHKVPYAVSDTAFICQCPVYLTPVLFKDVVTGYKANAELQFVTEWDKELLKRGYNDS